MGIWGRQELRVWIRLVRDASETHRKSDINYVDKIMSHVAEHRLIETG